jgi:hypothetical protein
LGPIFTANDVEGVAYQRGKQLVDCARAPDVASGVQSHVRATACGSALANSPSTRNITAERDHISKMWSATSTASPRMVAP